MKILKEFSSFKEYQRSEINESNKPKTLEDVRNIISECVLKTKNKPNEKDIEDVSERILKVMENNPKSFFEFFNNDYGIGSLITLEIYLNVFKKYGLLKTYLNPEMCKNLVPTSEDFFNDQERIAETFKDPKNYKKFQKLLNYIPSPEKVQYHVENIGMKKEILDYASKICNLVSAVSADNINSLNQNEKDLLIDLGLEFISNFSNASKLKEQSPKIYDAIASEGSDAVDSFSTLGDLGF